MREDERRLDAVGASPRAVYWGVLVVSGALALALGVAGLRMLADPDAPGAWAPLGSAGALAGGAAWLVVTWSFHRNYLHVPRPAPRLVRVEDAGGGPAVVVVWRTVFRRQPLLVSLVVVLAGVGWTAALVALDHWAWWVPLLVVAPVLLGLPDRLLELARPLRLVLTPAGVGTTALDGDAWLDWDDVREIAVVQADQWAVVRVLPVTRPASWRHRRRARFVPAAAAGEPCLDVPGPALPVDPGAVIAALEHYRATPAARAELAGEAGRRRVLGEVDLGRRGGTPGTP
ncbi:MAG: hypothetical protein ABW025_16775 [Cellulomonas sp.]